MKLKITFIAYVSITGVNSVIGLGIKDGIRETENDNNYLNPQRCLNAIAGVHRLDGLHHRPQAGR